MKRVLDRMNMMNRMGKTAVLSGRYSGSEILLILFIPSNNLMQRVRGLMRRVLDRMNMMNRMGREDLWIRRAMSSHILSILFIPSTTLLQTNRPKKRSL